MDHAYWGPEFDDGADAGRARARRRRRTRSWTSDELIDRTADALAEGKVVGWYQGRMEFGPRALGNRSILDRPAPPGDEGRPERTHQAPRAVPPVRPRRPRGGAPATYFTKDHPSPFMLMTYPVRPEKTRCDPGADPRRRHRPAADRAPRPEPALLRPDQGVRRRTGVPVLLNTSFNENEPICCTPEEAVDTFVRTKMDVLVIGRPTRREDRRRELERRCGSSVVNQYFHPDRSATSQLLTELCEDLAEHHDVTSCAGARRYDPSEQRELRGLASPRTVTAAIGSLRSWSTRSRARTCRAASRTTATYLASCIVGAIAGDETRRRAHDDRSAARGCRRRGRERGSPRSLRLREPGRVPRGWRSLSGSHPRADPACGA